MSTINQVAETIIAVPGMRRVVTGVGVQPRPSDDHLMLRTAARIAALVGATLTAGCEASILATLDFFEGEPCASPRSAEVDTAPPGWEGWDEERVIAHRGFARYNPENTLPAVEAVIAAGATAVEIDVRTTGDGVPILMHDATLERTTDRAGVVRRLSFASIRTANACVSHGSVCFVPTLEEVLLVARGKARVVIDAKEASACDRFTPIADVVVATGMEREVAFISGDTHTVENARALLGTVPIGWYPDPETSADDSAWRVVPVLISIGGAELLLPTKDVESRPAVYDSAVARGLPIVPWTVHREVDVERFLGIAAVSRVISDVVGSTTEG